jgi:hypothetical protein
MMRGLIAALEAHVAVYPLNDDRATPNKPKLP